MRIEWQMPFAAGPIPAEFDPPPTARKSAPADPIVMFDCESHDKPASFSELDLNSAPESDKTITELPRIASGAGALTEMFERISVTSAPFTEIELVDELPVTETVETMPVEDGSSLQLRRAPFETTTGPAPMSQRIDIECESMATESY
jgi:hypothetical protein